MPEDLVWKKYASRFKTFPPLIGAEFNHAVKIIICIPVQAEPELLKTLESLFNCYPARDVVEIILLFNKTEFLSDEEKSLHENSWNDIIKWIKVNPKEGINVFPVTVDNIPHSKGGVGFARKLVMDEAARRLPSDGVIICLDADCIVLPNYINTIETQFKTNANCDAASIYFEHRLDDLGEPERKAITLYELHLRYLVQAQRWCGHPFAFHTVGSSMAVRRDAYLLQGGMNSRQAGEDFYFLQKFIETGKLFEINDTTVFPSARVSNRVPFGTGKAMQQITKENKQWLTTNFEIFRQVKPLFDSVDNIRDLLINHSDDMVVLQGLEKLSKPMMEYLDKIEFLKNARLIGEQTTSGEAFRKRFFRYFNAFRMIRYMHEMRDLHYPDVPVTDAVCKLLIETGDNGTHLKTEEDYLLELRKRDKARCQLNQTIISH